jgi:zinc transport system substrate-binding protein
MLINSHILKEEININKYFIYLCVIFILFLNIHFVGCIEDFHSNNSNRIGILVTIVPQFEMVKSIGGKHVEITIMVPQGESPHYFEPKPSQMTKVTRAKAYFKVGSGVEFEIVHLDTIIEQNEDLIVFDCSKEIEVLSFDHHFGKNHQDEENGGHDHEGTDPHIWTSPINYKKMVNVVYDGLIEIDPKHKQEYESNFNELTEKLDKLDMNLRNLTRPYDGKSFLVYHPAWGYFADSYNLTQVAIEEQGKQPGPAGVAAIIEQAKNESINVIFVSPQFDITSAGIIASEIDGRVVFADPLMNDFESTITQLTQDMIAGFENKNN